MLLTTVQTKMRSWLSIRPIVLDEIIRLDGPGDVLTNICGSCLDRGTTALYRCLECSYGLLFCGECVVRSHQTSPLHRLEVSSVHAQTLPPCITLMFFSAGRTGFSTEHLYSLSGLSVTLDMEALHVPQTRPLALSPSSTPMAGTGYVSDSVAVGRGLRYPNNTVNCYGCVGIRRPSTDLALRSPLTFLKHTTR